MYDTTGQLQQIFNATSTLSVLDSDGKLRSSLVFVRFCSAQLVIEMKEVKIREFAISE